MRSAFQNLARDPDVRLGRIIAFLLFGAPWVAGNAAGLLLLLWMLRLIPVRGPFPHIADHILDAVAVWGKRIHRRRPFKPVFTKILPGELPLPEIGHVFASGPEFVSPGVFRPFQATSRCKFP